MKFSIKILQLHIFSKNNKVQKILCNMAVHKTIILFNEVCGENVIRTIIHFLASRKVIV